MLGNEIDIIRKENLRRLLKERFNNNQTLFAKEVNRKSPQISHLIRDYKAFGEDLARKFESSLGLPKGWFDKANQSIDLPALNQEVDVKDYLDELMTISHELSEVALRLSVIARNLNK